jgi:hypothetical protein
VLVGVAVLVAITAMVGGFALGRKSGHGHDTTATKIVSASEFSVRLPSHWRESRDRVDLAGLALNHPIAFSPAASVNRSTLILGVSHMPDSSLLLPQVREDLSGPVELYVTRLRDGALTAMCVGGEPGFRHACESAVATVRVPAVESDLDLRQRRVLDHAVRQLNDARTRGIGAMRSAHRAKEQALAARAIGEAYNAAAREVANGSRDRSSVVSRTRIIGALDGAGSSWLRLAGIAQDQSASRYEVASFLVESAESWVRAAIDRDVHSNATLRVSAVGTSSANPNPPPRADDAKPCSPGYPEEEDVRESWKPFLQVCSHDAGTSLLVKNKSTLVLVVHHDGHATNVPQERDSLSAQVVGMLVRPECGGTPCKLVPGASLRIDAAGRRVHVDFEVGVDDTLTTAFARVLVGSVEDRLTTRGSARAKQMATCAAGFGSILDQEDWQDRFRTLLTDGGSCTTLAKDADKTEVAKKEPLASKLIKRGQKYSGGTWVDGLLYGSEEVIGLVKAVRR